MSNTLDQAGLYQIRERYYNRNLISMLLEGFAFSFAIAMFSTESVLPSYLRSINNRDIYLSMISVLYYSVMYGSTIFSSIIALRARSPKWANIWVCLLERVGFLLILISSFFTGDPHLAVILFFVSLVLYALSVGLAQPLFAQMMSTIFHRNIGNVIGLYGLSSAAGGVFASLLLTRSLARYDFPMSYQVVFLAGLLFSLVSTAIVMFGVVERTDDRVTEKIKLKDVFKLMKDILVNNPLFRKYSIIRIVTSFAEFAIPYYIISASELPVTPKGFVGIMATIFLLAKMVSSLLFGKIGDRYGAIMILRFSCICGLIAVILALVMNTWPVAVLMYIFLAFAVNGVYLSTNIAAIDYSNRTRTPVYNATVSLLCAPAFIIASLVGVSLIARFSFSIVYVLAGIAYLTGMILTLKEV